MGSSGKYFGVAPPMPIETAATRMAVNAQFPTPNFQTTKRVCELANWELEVDGFLEDIAKPQDEVLAAAAPEGALDTQEDAGLGAEPEADAIVGLEILEIQVLDTRGDLAGI